ncbi:MAG: Uma2 family endonuclease [Clostridiales bacterium]|nr:Uma2 family endonuclease [Clostridiales bacterium]
MTVEEMRKRKKDLGYTNEMISEWSGVPLGTVQKIFAGVTASPRYETMRALEKALDAPWLSEEQASAPAADRGRDQKSAMSAGSAMIREPAVAYGLSQGQQGGYTLKDYYALPDERRAELIDGRIYDMAAPTSIHQILVSEIWSVLRTHIRKQGGECIAMVSPLDVQLDCDDRTMVQPDIVVICDRSRIIQRCVYGAPDMVVEILSKSTRKKDMFIKLNKYMAAGVREYWMVDAKQKRVIVYDFETENYPVIYGFNAKIPVGIFGGECRVDFEELYDYVGFLYEKGAEE